MASLRYADHLRSQRAKQWPTTYPRCFYWRLEMWKQEPKISPKQLTSRLGSQYMHPNKAHCLICSVGEALYDGMSKFIEVLCYILRWCATMLSLLWTVPEGWACPRLTWRVSSATRSRLESRGVNFTSSSSFILIGCPDIGQSTALLWHTKQGNKEKTTCIM